jgi:hypothetical protein
MRPTIGDIVVCVALLEQPRKSLSKQANIVRNLLGAKLEKIQKLYESIFDRSQNARFEGLGRPAFRNVPAHRHAICEIALGFLVASFTAPTDGPNVERAAATAHGGRSVHTVPAFRFTGLVE